VSDAEDAWATRDREILSESAARRSALEAKHLSLQELAEREGVEVQTVYGWNKTGTGPRYFRAGHQCRYRLADVLAWEESRMVPARRIA
jgi:predicted DNA-binding transcriptional regulator AlpA